MNEFNDTYLSMIYEDVNPISSISKKELENLIYKKQIRNKNKNFKFKQISKYFLDKTPGLTYYILKNNDVVKAIAIATINNNLCYINSLGSLESGFNYGSNLLNHFLQQPFKAIYMCADWSQPNKLLNYYKNPKFGLSEYINPISNTHWFYKNRMMTFDAMNKFIKKHFI